MLNRQKVVSVYADGSSTGRANKPGGYGWVITVDDMPIQCGYGGLPNTTNNEMELMAAVEGLKALAYLLKGRKDEIYAKIELVCDSQYVLGMASGEMSPQKNIELATEVRRLSVELGVITRWIRGHSGDEYNERCDRLAKRGKEEQCQVPTK